jgi:type IV secretory pathway TrbD component
VAADRELNHVTGRVAVVVAGTVAVLTSATFASMVWSVMLAMMVCVPCLCVTAIVWTVVYVRRYPSWRPPPQNVTAEVTPLAAPLALEPVPERVPALVSRSAPPRYPAPTPRLPLR